MAQILARDVDEKLVKRLKTQAKRHGRSLQGEVRSILESAAQYSPLEAQRVLRNWQARLAGRKFTDSAELVREDRDR
jgi:plasmid stability protein